MASSTREVIQTTLLAALAPSGTLTLGYPAGTNPGSFINGVRHRVVTGANDVFKAPKYFTLSYGATTITLTWAAGAPTLPIGTKLFIQLDRAGSNPQHADEARAPSLNDTAALSLKLVNLGAPAAAASNNIAASQSVAAAASFSLNGALLSAVATGKVILDKPRNVVAAWTTTSILTITGRDDYGNAMAEVSASGTSHTGKKAFKEITSVSSSASITGATIGTGNVLGLPVFIPDVSAILAEMENGVNVKPAGKVFLPWEVEATELAAGTPEYIVSPVDGYIDQQRGIVGVAIVTGGDITTEVNGVAVTGLTLTAANSDAAGTRYADRPTTPRSSTTVVAKGDSITVTPAAAFNGGGSVNGVLEIEPSGLQGTLVAGQLAAAQSGTTGDVRGTYTPRTTPDGSVRYALLLALADANFLGDDQYAG